MLYVKVTYYFNKEVFYIFPRTLSSYIQNYKYHYKSFPSILKMFYANTLQSCKIIFALFH